jgi:hypothetical protein
VARQRKKAGEGTDPESPGSEGQPGEEATSDLDKQARELLGIAAKLIAEPSAWTRREFARDRHSHPVSPSSQRAVRFCVSGALLRAASERFGAQFKFGEGESIWDEPWAAPLALAFRYLGHSLVLVLLAAPVAASLVEREVDGQSLARLTLRAPGGEEQLRTVEVPWYVLVHGLNDHPAVKHLDILTGLTVARVPSFGRELDEGMFNEGGQR